MRRRAAVLGTEDCDSTHNICVYDRQSLHQAYSMLTPCLPQAYLRLILSFR